MGTTNQYVAYGLKIQTSTRLPVLLPGSGGTGTSLSLSIEQGDKKKMRPLSYEAPLITLHGKTIRLSSDLPLSFPISSKKRCWKLEVGNEFLFDWRNISNKVRAWYFTSEPDLFKLAFWLLHTIIPVYLILKGTSLFLHAAAIEFDKKAILFLAPSQGGKSTLADIFVQRGHRLLSDDKIRLHLTGSRCLAFPSYPYLRRSRKNENLGDFTESFSNEPLYVSTFYELNFVNPQNKCEIIPLSGLHKFEVFKRSYLYQPVSISIKEGELLMHLAKHYKLYQIKLPKNVKKLSAVYNTIVSHIEQRGITRDSDFSTL